MYARDHAAVRVIVDARVNRGPFLRHHRGKQEPCRRAIGGMPGWVGIVVAGLCSINRAQRITWGCIGPEAAEGGFAASREADSSFRRSGRSPRKASSPRRRKRCRPLRGTAAASARRRAPRALHLLGRARLLQRGQLVKLRLGLLAGFAGRRLQQPTSGSSDRPRHRLRTRRASTRSQAPPRAKPLHARSCNRPHAITLPLNQIAPS